MLQIRTNFRTILRLDWPEDIPIGFNVVLSMLYRFRSIAMDCQYMSESSSRARFKGLSNATGLWPTASKDGLTTRYLLIYLASLPEHAIGRRGRRRQRHKRVSDFKRIATTIRQKFIRRQPSAKILEQTASNQRHQHPTAVNQISLAKTLPQEHLRKIGLT